MKRRGFLAGLVAAPIAAPSAVKAAMNAPYPTYPTSPSPAMGYGMLSGAGQTGPDPKFLLQRVADIRKLLSKPVSQTDREDCLAGMLGSIMLDPDIEAMRSFSGTAKARLQRERMVEREMARRKSWLQRELDGLLEHLGPLGDALR